MSGKTENKLDIRLNIAGRSYSLCIDREKEEICRRAEKEINKWVATLQSQFNTDREGYLAMAALQLALQNVEMSSSRSLGEDVDALVEIEGKLDRFLNEIEK